MGNQRTPRSREKLTDSLTLFSPLDLKMASDHQEDMSMEDHSSCEGPRQALGCFKVHCVWLMWPWYREKHLQGVKVGSHWGTEDKFPSLGLLLG